MLKSENLPVSKITYVGYISDKGTSVNDKRSKQ